MLDTIEHGAVELQLVGYPGVVTVAPAALGEIYTGNGQAAEVGDNESTFYIEVRFT